MCGQGKNQGSKYITRGQTLQFIRAKAVRAAETQEVANQIRTEPLQTILYMDDLAAQLQK